MSRSHNRLPGPAGHNVYWSAVSGWFPTFSADNQTAALDPEPSFACFIQTPTVQRVAATYCLLESVRSSTHCCNPSTKAKADLAAAFQVSSRR